MSRIEPVDHTLKIHTQSSACCSEAHPFQMHLDRLRSELRRVAHWLLDGCEVPLALFASGSFTPCLVPPCLRDVLTTLAVGVPLLP